jgi:hypothetical protein
VLTCWVLVLRFLMALFRVSAIYTLPDPSTATPCGPFKPDETSAVTVPIRVKLVPVCVTVYVKPEIVSVPVWAAALVFAL